MTTLENIKVQIAAKPGWIRTVEQSHKHVSDTDREFTFQIYFKDSDNVVRDTFCKVYASAFGTASEAAEIVGTIPDLATEPTTSAFRAAVDAEIAKVKAKDAKIKRIVLERFDEQNTYCIATVYSVDNAATPTKVSKSQYFAYDDGGLKIYPYAG